MIKTTTQKAFSKASFVEINYVSLHFSNIVNGQKCQSVKVEISQHHFTGCVYYCLEKCPYDLLNL